MTLKEHIFSPSPSRPHLHLCPHIPHPGPSRFVQALESNEWKDPTAHRRFNSNLPKSSLSSTTFLLKKKKRPFFG